MLKRRLPQVIAILFSVALLTGCSFIARHSYSMNDQMFAAMMIPHHQQAIEMSDLALSRSNNPQVLDLARKIKAAQAPEIAEMKTWGEGLDHMLHSGMTMGGMLTDQQMERLRSTSGEEFDRLFLAGMIEHHQGAIEMAQNILDSKNPHVRDFASTIITTQADEISIMKGLLELLTNSND